MSETPSELEDCLLEEIKARFPDGITKDEYLIYERRYLRSLGQNPGQNWLSKMAWAHKHLKDFRCAFKREGILILPNPPVRLHDHDLHESGYQRLSELQDQIANQSGSKEEE